jgi:hypothetical protein
MNEESVKAGRTSGAPLPTLLAALAQQHDLGAQRSLLCVFFAVILRHLISAATLPLAAGFTEFSVLAVLIRLFGAKLASVKEVLHERYGG